MIRRMAAVMLCLLVIAGCSGKAENKVQGLGTVEQVNGQKQLNDSDQQDISKEPAFSEGGDSADASTSADPSTTSTNSNELTTEAYMAEIEEEQFVARVVHLDGDNGAKYKYEVLLKYKEEDTYYFEIYDTKLGQKLYTSEYADLYMTKDEMESADVQYHQENGTFHMNLVNGIGREQVMLLEIGRTFITYGTYEIIQFSYSRTTADENDGSTGSQTTDCMFYEWQSEAELFCGVQKSGDLAKDWSSHLGTPVSKLISNIAMENYDQDYLPSIAFAIEDVLNEEYGLDASVHAQGRLNQDMIFTIAPEHELHGIRYDLTVLLVNEQNFGVKLTDRSFMAEHASTIEWLHLSPKAE